MERGPYSKGVAKRREIIEIAMTAVSELGYQNVSLREIARRVGMSQTGLIHYFPNKEALYIEVLRHRDEIGREAEHDDILGHMVMSFAEAFNSKGLMHLFTVLSAEAVNDQHLAHPFFVERYERLCQRFADGLQKLVANGGLEEGTDTISVARILVAAMDGLQSQWLVNPDFDPAATFSYLWDLIRTGCQPPVVR